MAHSGCLPTLGSFLALFLFYAFGIFHGFESGPARWYGAFFGSLTTGLLARELVPGLRPRFSEAAGLQAEADGMPLRDGEREVVSGPVLCSGEPLVSPVSRTACAAYDFTVLAAVPAGDGAEADGAREEVRVLASGCGLAPCAVRSPRGDVRLLAFPELTDGEKEKRSGWRVREALERLPASGPGPDEGALLTPEESGRLDRQGPVTRWRPPGGPLPEDRLLSAEEQLLLVGRDVTASGVFSAERMGFVRDGGSAADAIEVKLGGGLAMLLHLRRQRAIRLIWLWVAFAAVHALVVPVALFLR